MEERRLILALSLSLLAFVILRMIFPPPAKVEPEVATPPSTASAPVSAVATSLPVAGSPAAPSGTAAVVVVPSRNDTRERRVDVTTRDIEVGFTNRGARLLSWRLKQFPDASGHPEEMVEASSVVRPFDLETGDATVDERIREALFVPSADEVNVAPGEHKNVAFEYGGGDLEVKKKFSFDGSGYLVGVAVSVRRGGTDVATKIVWGPGVGNPTDTERQVRGYQEPAGAALVGSTVEQTNAAKLSQSVSYPDVTWVGVDGHYFAALWIPPGGHGQGEVRQAVVPAVGGGESRKAAVALLALQAGHSDALIYVGPKEYRQMLALDHGLAHIVNVGGWFGPIPFHLIVIFFMDLLRWLHARVGNYGWAIILLTVLMNVLMSPLRHYGVVNGIKMAKIAPEMKVIQERYKKFTAFDPRKQQMQKEMAELYERHGMNMGTQMAVGCFPTLLTLPFLYAFYRVLAVSIDLRGAHWGWIPDLSQRDPLFITPILMAISMFISQRTMPTSMDPAQQRMMMIMPIVLATVFFAAPAGLNLYWFASNVCTLVQQVVTLRIVRDRDNRSEAPAGRRRR